jgi:hypothetical protein
VVSRSLNGDPERALLGADPFGHRRPFGVT